MEAPRVNDIVRERRAVTVETAARLARYFGTSARFWMNLQADYDLKVIEDLSGTLIAEEIRPRAPA